jgi:hypothetical protein
MRLIPSIPLQMPQVPLLSGFVDIIHYFDIAVYVVPGERRGAWHHYIYGFKYAFCFVLRTFF